MHQFYKFLPTACSRWLLAFCYALSFSTVQAQVPTIASFSPEAGYTGTRVTINGTSFNTTAANNIVYFGATKGTVTAASATQLTVAVPAGATFKPITVLNSGTGLSAFSKKPFMPSIAPYTSTNFTAASFSPYSIYHYNVLFRGIAAADFDGDGKVDIVATSTTGGNNVYILKNTTTGSSITFSATPVILPLGASSRLVYTGDIDNDGKIDIFAASQASTNLFIFRNTSTGSSISFGARVDITTDNNVYAAAIGDLDADGKPDFALATFAGSKITVLKNGTTPGSITNTSFTKTNFAANTNSGGIAIGDIDGDGKPDIAVAENDGNLRLSLYRNTTVNGTIDANSFAAKVDFEIGAPGTFGLHYTVALGDMDGDGKLDVVIPKQGTPGVAVYRNISTPGAITTSSLAARLDVPVTFASSGGELADMNGDGKLDIVVVSSTKAVVIRNTASSGSLTSSSFAAGVEYNTSDGTAGSPNAVALADLNGDGRIDIIPSLPNSGHTMSIITNTITTTPPSTPTDVNAAANEVPEGAANGAVVGITASSTDLNGASVTYSLTNNAGGRFAIHSSTGVVTVTNGALLDYETATTHTITVQSSNGSLNSTQSFTIAVTDVVETTPLISTISSSTNVTCNGGSNGSASVTASGGVSPYTYSWSPSGGTGATTTGRTAGTYTVTVTDAASASTTATVSITQPSALSISSAKADVSCHGGSNGAAAVSVSGGTGPYSYSWAPSGGTNSLATGRTAGTYTVTITDNVGCTATRTFNITQPATALSGSTVVTNVSCFGGSNGTINLTASGGTSPYTYNWGSGITTEDRTGLTAGTYTVVITDFNNCQTTVTASVTQPSAPVSGTTVVMNVSSNGGSDGTINLTPSGGTAPYTYNWGSGITTEDRTGLTAGTYTVVITDNNSCTGTVTAAVTQPTSVTVSSINRNNPASAGIASVSYAVTFSGSVTGLSTSNFSLSTTGLAGASITSVAGSGSSYTVNVNTGTGDGTLQLNLANSSGISPSVSNAPYTSGQSYTITKTFTSPVLQIKGTGGSTGTDVTAFLDEVELVNTSTNTVVSGALQNGGFEMHGTLSSAGMGFGAQPAGASWTFHNSGAGIAKSGSAFGAPTPYPAGTSVAYIQMATDGISQNLTLPSGSYQVRFKTAQRNCCSGANDQALQVFVNGVYVGQTQPANNNAYTTFNSSTFSAVAPTPTATISGSTNVSCFGGSNGSATVTASGGTSPYTYSWAPAGGTSATATGLSAGTYTVTFTDALAETATAIVSITQPNSPVSGTTVVTDVACFGGNTGGINVTASGGTAPYTYNWGSGVTSEDRTNLTAGTYTVVITDANGCTGSLTAAVTQPGALSVTVFEVIEITCYGAATGELSTYVSGGTAPYSYQWSSTGTNGSTNSSISGLGAGSYAVTVTDARGCTETGYFKIFEPSQLDFSTVVTNVSCFGGSNGAINLTPSGGTGPYTYNWGSGITTEDRTGLTAGTYTVVITDNNSCTGTVTVAVTQPVSPVSGTTVVTNVSCFGGSNGAINVTPSGGTGPYTYNWLPSGPTTEDRTGLTAGTYTVQITDNNGCTSTVTASITQPVSPVSGTTVVTNVACFGGSNGAINLTPSGGTGPYTYNWLPSGPTTEDRTGLVAGTYTVIITDNNGCTGTVTTSVTQPVSPVSGTTVVTNVSCFGGSNGAINLTPSGGTGPYTYNWLPSGPTTEDRTGLVAGTYTVQITDANACTGTVTVAVTQPVSPVSASTVVTNVSCSGGSNGAINVTPSGGTSPYTYNWGGGITTEDRTGLTAGTYTVIITDNNGCTGTVTASVTQPSAPVSASTVVTNVACNGGSNGAINVTPSGGTGPYTYLWNGGATTEDRTGLSAGTYTVVITDNNGCTGTRTVAVMQPSSIAATTSKTDVSTFGGSDGSATVSVSGGTPGYTYSWSPSGGTAATASSLSAGTYTVTVTDNNSCQVTRTFSITEPAAPTTSTWNGSNGTNWNDPNNWTPAGVPTATSTVVIPNGVTPPNTAGITISIQNLVIQPGGSFTMSGGTINVSGNITNNGTFVQTGGTINLNGTSNQTIDGNPVTFFNLTVGTNGATMNTAVNIQGVLTLTGTMTTSGNTLTLLSNTSGTAMIVNNPGTVAGSITMQRDIDGSVNAGTGYRHFASPVQNTTVADLAAPGFTPIVNPAYNTASNPAAVKPFPNVLMYNQDPITTVSAATSSFDYGWMSPTALGDVMVPGRGYSVNIGAGSTPDLAGTPNNGTITVTNLNNGGLAASGWHLLGNPYPSPIDWDLITKPSGMYPSVYVQRSTGKYAGNWIGYVNGVGGITDGILPSMQGFFVQCTTNVASFSFTNAARVTTYGNPGFYRTSAETRPVLKLNLNNGQNKNEDETYVYLESGASAQFEGDKDAYKIGGGNASLYTLAGTDALAVNGLGTASNQQVPLVVSGNAGSLSIAVGEMVNFNSYDVVLEDKALNSFTTLTSTSSYSFSHAGGTVANRFVVHINAKVNSINSSLDAVAVNVYPNPTDNKAGFVLVMSNLKAEKLTAVLYNSLGQQIETRTVKALNGKVTETFSTEKLAQGVYTLSVTSGTTKAVKKIVVQ